MKRNVCKDSSEQLHKGHKMRFTQVEGGSKVIQAEVIEFWPANRVTSTNDEMAKEEGIEVKNLRW